MPQSRSLADVQAHLAESIAAVETGERVVLMADGKPVAALVSIADLKRLQADDAQAGLAGLIGAWDEDPEGDAAIAAVIAGRPAGRCLSDTAS